MWFVLLRCTLFLALAGTGSFVHALTASCSEGNGGYYDNSRNCTFRNVIVDDVATTVTFSSGSGYRYNTPYHFRFVDSKLIEVPRKIFDSYSTVQLLGVAECSIESISRYTFEKASSLLLLNLSTNSLQEVKNYVFTGASSLNHLDLSNNNISVIEEKAFANFLNTQTIVVGGFKSESLIADKTNVKGIYCTDDTNPLNEWNTTLKHLDKYLNNSEPIVKQTILDVKLSQLQNATTNDTFVSSDLKRMMTELNVLTETKFNLTSQKLELKIYEQSFKIDKFMDKINENAEKLLILRKQLDQTANPAFASYNPATFQGLKSEPSTAGSSHTLTIVIMGTLIVLLVAALAVLYRKSRRVTLRGKSCYSTSNTLATMMDNDI
ncbi:hypothetical protein quinque_002020 [Culex quinquefasciatus]